MLNYGKSNNGSYYLLSAYYVQGILCYLSYLILTNKTLTFCQESSRRLNHITKFTQQGGYGDGAL